MLPKSMTTPAQVRSPSHYAQCQSDCYQRTIRRSGSHSLRETWRTWSRFRHKLQAIKKLDTKVYSSIKDQDPSLDTERQRCKSSPKGNPRQYPTKSSVKARAHEPELLNEQLRKYSTNSQRMLGTQSVDKLLKKKCLLSFGRDVRKAEKDKNLSTHIPHSPKMAPT